MENWSKDYEKTANLLAERILQLKRQYPEVHGMERDQLLKRIDLLETELIQTWQISRILRDRYAL